MTDKLFDYFDNELVVFVFCVGIFGAAIFGAFK